MFLLKLLLVSIVLCKCFRTVRCDTAYSFNPKIVTSGISEGPAPTVTLKQGTFIGRTLKSRGGRNYYSFVGMRYAKAVERFQQIADLPDASDAVLNATEYGPFCLQHDWFKNLVLGDEDCLYINVYTPMLPGFPNEEVSESEESSSKKPKGSKIPVMMYIHGGAFLFGSGNVYLPDYFMDEDVIILTMNYRLGVLGFLSTQDSVIQGNMGLKDQVVALRWVQENIFHFGGDASRVTIFGESAGGASVSYHLISPMSKGLFKQGISHSGTALCPWSFVRNPKRVAIKFAEFLDCPTNSSEAMLQCLKSRDAKTIVTTQEKLTIWNRDPFALFGPSVEIPSIAELDLKEIILPDTPFQLLCKGTADRVPWILGVCKDEGLLFHSATILHNKVLLNEMNTNWSRVAPVTLIFDETARDSSYVSKKVRKYYFDNQPVTQKSLKNLTSLYSDRYFFYCTQASALLYAAKATPTYLYEFSYEGQHSILQAFGLPKYGIAHGDDLQYFFPYSKFPFLPLSTEKGQFSQKVIRLWTRFAEIGIPEVTAEGDEVWDKVSLEESSGAKPIRWYSLNVNSTVMIDPYHDRMTFWKNLPLHEGKAERKFHKVYPIGNESQLRTK